MAEFKSTRNNCFTLNNYTEDEYESIKCWAFDYIVVGKELGEEKTPHLQGYVEWGRSVRFQTLKKLNGRIHWEKRMGTPDQAATYCKKEGNFWESGLISEQGKRSDLEQVVDMIKNKKSKDEIAENFGSTFVKYHKGIECLINSMQKDRTEPPFVTWLWGKAGTGKTRTPVEKHVSHYIKDGTMWWNGYQQDEAIIIDDFDGHWPYRDLLRLLDRYKYQGQTKGGYVKINSPYIYITCEYPPSHFWSGNELDQVLRRINSVAEVVGNTIASTTKDTEEVIYREPNIPEMKR